MPKLPPDFIFSQANLQDFLACPQRFYLRYLRRLAWPSGGGSQALEWERHLSLAQDFHRLAHQKALGIPDLLLQPLVQKHSDELLRWWTQLAQFWQTEQDGVLLGRRYSELTLSAPLGEARLLAKYDLLVAHPDGRWTIVDWKTTQHRPPSNLLRGLVQSRLYPYLVVRAGAMLQGGEAVRPERVRMIYWFANYPNDPEILPYSESQLRADEEYLSHLVLEILGRREADFERTSDERACAFCRYRTYCERSFLPAEKPDVELYAELLELSLPQEWEQIGEIEY